MTATLPQDYSLKLNEESSSNLEIENLNKDLIENKTSLENEVLNSKEKENEETKPVFKDELIICQRTDSSSLQKLERKLYFLKYIFRFFKYFINFLYNHIKMMNSDVNAAIDIILRIVGIPNHYINKKLLKKLFFLALAVLSLVQSKNDGAYQNFQTNRLFSRHSLVTDFFQGELSLLKEEILESDLTVVMYYAPWDRQSLNFVQQFLKVAHYYHEQVSFAAINCWLPVSECQQHLKFHFFPVVILHVKVSSLDEHHLIPYNGPLSAHHLIRFIGRAIRPFIYISNHVDLMKAQLENQALVLGHYAVGNFNHDFLNFYLAALSKLQFEHMSSVKYAIVTSPHLAKMITFAGKSSIHLITWNTTLVFPPTVEKNPKNITKFVNLHLSQVIHWLPISGKKSFSLSNIYQEGPFILVFTPDNPYHQSNDPFQVTRSLALEYFSCHQSLFQLWLSKHLSLQAQEDLREYDKACRVYLKRKQHEGCSIYSSVQNSDRNTCLVNALSRSSLFEDTSSGSYGVRNPICQSFLECDTSPNVGRCRYWDVPQSYQCSGKNGTRTGRQEDRSKRDEETTLQNWLAGPKEDDHVAKLSKTYLEECCNLLVLGSSLSPPPLAKNEPPTQTVEGLGCKTNRTLKFFAVDSLLHQDFAEKLGLDLTAAEPILTGSVIIDPANEERYVMEYPFTKNKLASFVYNFTNNLLDRGKLLRGFEWKKKCAPGEVCVMELNGGNYLQTISQPKQAFVVMHYSRHCGACGGVASTFLKCLYLTSGISSVTFARIDVSKNTLPWHLTFDTVPTFVFFPHNNESQSRVFDPTIPVTVKNLMRFILPSLSATERSAIAMKLCGTECQKSATGQSLIVRIKLQQSISVVSSRLKRITASLAHVKSRMNEDTSDSAASKYALFLRVKARIKRKLFALKSKVAHLSQWQTYMPLVPSQFSNQLSYETKLLFDRNPIE